MAEIRVLCRHEASMVGQAACPTPRSILVQDEKPTLRDEKAKVGGRKDTALLVTSVC